LFTESKIQNLQYQSKSKHYIKQYLIQKGVNKELVSEQISAFYLNNENLEKENALKFAKKRNLFDNKIDYQKKLSRMARAGFSYDVAKEILK
jgi:SOS response regulatory protein OraA/RecX